MKNILRLIAVLYLFAFVQSCRKDDTSLGYDLDAQRFFDSSGITDYTQRFAINTFVIQLKNSLLWEKFIAIYPMAGGTETTNKWNLKDPRNTDSAYRLTFTGAPVYASTGVLFPTNSDYADTHLTDGALNYNDNSISYYSRTQNTVNGYDMGCNDNAAPYNEMAIYSSNDASNWFGYYDFGPKPASTVGLFMFSSTSSTVTRYENGVVKNSSATAPVMGSTGLSILIGKVANGYATGKRECALAAVGNGLNDVQAMTFYYIVQSYESALRR